MRNKKVVCNVRLTAFNACHFRKGASWSKLPAGAHLPLLPRAQASSLPRKPPPIIVMDLTCLEIFSRFLKSSIWKKIYSHFKQEWQWEKFCNFSLWSKSNSFLDFEWEMCFSFLLFLYCTERKREKGKKKPNPLASQCLLTGKNLHNLSIFSHVSRGNCNEISRCKLSTAHTALLEHHVSHYMSFTHPLHSWADHTRPGQVQCRAEHFHRAPYSWFIPRTRLRKKFPVCCKPYIYKKCGACQQKASLQWQLGVHQLTLISFTHFPLRHRMQVKKCPEDMGVRVPKLLGGRVMTGFILFTCSGKRINSKWIPGYQLRGASNQGKAVLDPKQKI